MNSIKKKIIHVGVSGFPYTINASINRCIAIYSIIPKDKYSISVINNRSVDKSVVNSLVSSRGIYKGITFLFTPPSIIKPKKFLNRRYNNFIGRFNEIALLLKMASHKEIDLMIFYPTGNFLDLLLYRFISNFFSFPLIIHYVEFRSSFKKRNGFLQKINDKLFDSRITNFSDGIIPISEFLIKKIRDKSPLISILKIPPIVDYSLFFQELVKVESDFFLYVGSSGYINSIQSIIDAFDLIGDKEYSLFLIISGDKNELFNRIAESKKKHLIKVFSNLEYRNLLNYYMNAKALLIPLSKSVQDKARFPQKISEYLASKKPIITTNNGEIPFYFTNKYNALIAKDDSSQAIAIEMKYVIENPEKVKEIGKKGFEMGKKHFDSKNYSIKISDFLMSTFEKH